MKTIWLPALTLFCGACVTLNEPVLTPQAIGKDQRTILLVFPSPGPWVITDSESKAEAAAKMLPGISFVVQSFQDDRYKAASDTLRRYIPHWRPGELFEPLLLKELARAGFPGHFIPAAETELDTATVRAWNRAADTLDWQTRYFYGDPALPLPRDYSRVLSLDDALTFEVNLLPYVAADDDGNMVPTLSASTRLLRCQTMHLLWKHEDKAEDTANARSLYEFETLPQQLVDRWKGLMPGLAAKVSGSLYTALHPGSTATYSGAVSNISAPAASTPTLTIPAAPVASSGTVSVSTEAAASISTAAVFAVPAASTGTGTTPPIASSATVTGTVTPAISSQTITVPILPEVSSPTVTIPAVVAPSSPTTTSPPAPAVSSGTVPVAPPLAPSPP